MSRTVGPSVMKAMIRNFSATHGAHQREHFVDAGEQQCPGVAGGAPMGRFGGGLRDGCGRRGGRPRREGGDRSAQGRVGARTPKWRWR